MAAAGAIVGAPSWRCGMRPSRGVARWNSTGSPSPTIRDAAAVPSFLGYHGFPRSICSSVNDRVVHGIPSAEDILVEGDLVSIDCGAILDGWHGDSAWTFGVGTSSRRDDALSRGHPAVDGGRYRGDVAGNRLTDVSHAIELGTQAAEKRTAASTASSTATAVTPSAARCTWTRSCRTRARRARARSGHRLGPGHRADADPRYAPRPRCSTTTGPW